MAYYYNIDNFDDSASSYKGFLHKKFNKTANFTPKKDFDFSRYVLIELLDNSTPEAKLWKELGLANNKNIVHKRMMIDSHRINCRRAVIICKDVSKAKKLAECLSQTKIMKRCICAVVIEELLSDLRLFERQVLWFGDKRSQHQLLYVSELNKYRKPLELVQFLKEKFSLFGTVLSVYVCAADDGYTHPEGVIKFAYLSEAFAAELAYDQYVVGKEQLSVTTHHNILLSQCDLRLRLRNAQSINLSETNTFTESYLHHWELQKNNVHNGDLTNSVYTHQISNKEIDTEKYINAFNYKLNSYSSKYREIGSKINLHDSKCETKLDMFANSTVSAPCDNKKKDETTHVSEKKVLPSLKSNKSIPIFNSMMQNNSHLIHKKRLTEFSGNKPKNIKGRNSSCFESESDLKYESSHGLLKKSEVIKMIISNCDRHSTINECEQNALKFCSTSNKRMSHNPECSSQNDNMIHDHSNKTVVQNAECSFKYNCNMAQNQVNKIISNIDSSFQSDMLTQNQFVHSDFQQSSSVLLDSESTLEIPTTGVSKRKKRVISSQKLCLKSQRCDSYENKNLKKSNRKSDNCVICPSEEEIPQNNYANKSTLFTECLSSIPSELCDRIKIQEWLSQLPEKKADLNSSSNYLQKKTLDTNIHEQSLAQSEILDPILTRQKVENNCLCSDASDNKYEDQFNCIDKSYYKCNQLGRRITLHATPFLNWKNIVKQKKNRNLYPDKKYVENKDPNCVPLVDDTESPLKIWLKQELLVSVKNTVTTSEDISQSIIVCATKTRDIAISVGCSHMTCSFCYPDSTNLLLGFGEP